MNLVADVFPHPDGGYAARCPHHGTWRFRTETLTAEDLERAKTSLKRHASRKTTVQLLFIGCLPELP